MKKEVVSNRIFNWKTDLNLVLYILLGMILFAFLVAAQHYFRYAKQVEDFSISLNLSYQLIVFGSIALMAPLVFYLTDQFPLQGKRKKMYLLIHFAFGLSLAFIHGFLCNFLLYLVDLAPQLIFPRFWGKYLSTILHFWLLAYAALVALRSSQQSVQRKKQDNDREENESHFILGKVMLPYEDIVFFEAYDHYLKIHTLHKTYVIRSSLKKVLTLLPSKLFRQVHRSFIVYIPKVRSYKSDSTGGLCLEMEGDKSVRVSRSFRKEIEEDLLSIRY